MCGIAGLIDRAAGAEALARAAGRMIAALSHRGPDGEDTWLDAKAGVALGHRRLAIIDLSESARQPMVSSCGRFVLTYNGEIYNYLALKRELAERGSRFRTQSDSEVLLEACAAWGVRQALERLNGIFAFAVWDRDERVLSLARDHFGVKPLYWADTGGRVLFGSQLKALCAAGNWRQEIDLDALGAFMRTNYVPAPRTILRGVQKLPAGTLLTWRAGAGATVERYFDPRTVALAQEPLDLADGAAVEALDALLAEVVRDQMVSDVPVGAFLSGGIDSSIVTAFMQAASPQKVKTFTIGFHAAALDEARHAAAVARSLGTEHRELYVDEREALSAVPRLPAIYDEPFADASQIPTLILAELARKEVAVALSGDGGDELFGGYERYFWGERLWQSMRHVPHILRRASGAALTGILPAFPPRARHLSGKLVEILRHDGPDAIYRRLVSQWDEEVVQGAEPLPLPDVEAFAPFVPRAQMLDTLTYLPDDILVKVDRATMAFGLEARVPLLDPRVFAFAWGLAPHQRRRKALLKQVLARHVPPTLFDRPKMGFGVPMAAWLRGPLREWAEALLHRSGLLARSPVEKAWREHLSGERDWQYRLWTVLSFEAWHREWSLTTSSSAPARQDATRGSARPPLETLP